MIKYPLLFEASASSLPGISTTWSSSAKNFEPITCAIPLEFKGPDGGYSPENLLAMAAMNCFIGTFKVFAEKANLSFNNLKLKAVLTVDRLPSGNVGIAHLSIDVTLFGSNDPSRAIALLHETEQNCLVANSLKIQVNFIMHTV